MYTILLVEDDQPIREMLLLFLQSKNYRVVEAENGEQAMLQLNNITPDILLLDWMLPDTDGIKLLRKIRKNSLHKKLPVLMLTAKAEEADKITGLDAGADDYLTKPVSLKELDARIRALIRRAHGLSSEKLLQQSGISIDPENQIVTINNKSADISGIEYQLLYFFMKHPGRLYNRAQLLDRVWGQTTYVEERTVDVHIMRLRKKLTHYGIVNKLQTIRGAGYRFNADE